MHKKKSQVRPQISCPSTGWQEDNGHSTAIGLEERTASVGNENQFVRRVNGNTELNWLASEVSANTEATTPCTLTDEQGKA